MGHSSACRSASRRLTTFSQTFSRRSTFRQPVLRGTRSRVGKDAVMKRRLMYVELKSGYNDDGPAFIGWVTFSKTRKTVKVHGKNLERFQGGKANHFDTKNDDLY